MHPRLKKIIFNKLYEDLKHAEIIPYKESIWFIDREKKYWYLQYEKSGYLWWRFDFFPRFFRLFSMERSEFELVIADWVEEVLNFKVGTTISGALDGISMVEEVLNFKAGTTAASSIQNRERVEEVLNFKVNTTSKANFSPSTLVEEVLNFKVDITHNSVYSTTKVEEILDSTL